MARNIITTLLYVEKQSKGLPVGIPISPARAGDLVARGLLEWAPCGYLHLLNRKMSSARLTTAGETYIKLYRDRKADAHHKGRRKRGVYDCHI